DFEDGSLSFDTPSGSHCSRSGLRRLVCTLTSAQDLADAKNLVRVTGAIGDVTATVATGSCPAESWPAVPVGDDAAARARVLVSADNPNLALLRAIFDKIGADGVIPPQALEFFERLGVGLDECAALELMSPAELSETMRLMDDTLAVELRPSPGPMPEPTAAAVASDVADSSSMGAAAKWVASGASHVATGFAQGTAAASIDAWLDNKYAARTLQLAASLGIAYATGGLSYAAVGLAALNVLLSQAEAPPVIKAAVPVLALVSGQVLSAETGSAAVQSLGELAVAMGLSTAGAAVGSAAVYGLRHAWAASAASGSKASAANTELVFGDKAGLAELMKRAAGAGQAEAVQPPV
ncbi:MAG: hypothetical protein COW12_02310, partial [Candidatus Omnitrophica bacterium CG12_big_fil_rev_8_21_14_0_65_45_16]